MRRLPIFLLIDVSESMAGDNLRHLQEGMDRLVKVLRADPYALETAALSIIAFAGKAKTLTPLVDVFAFYPPRLPLGSGTSLGRGLTHLMDEMDRTVVKSTMDRKGDYRPVVYLMTDGKPTDDCEPALARWKRDFDRKASLVAIAIGPHASLATLSRLTSNVLRFDGSTEQDFKRFIDWVSASVVAQSRAVDEGGALSLAKPDEVMRKIEEITSLAPLDEDFVVIQGRCQVQKLPYLMKFERVRGVMDTAELRLSTTEYHLTGVFAAEKDFDDLSDERGVTTSISTEFLRGSPGCPHCGNPIGFAACSCGQILCVKGDGDAVCPGCHSTITMSHGGGDFDVTRSRG